MRRAGAATAAAMLVLSGCSLTEVAGLTWDLEQVEQDVRQDYEAKITDEYPKARVESVRCAEENESRLECIARLSGAERERTQLDVTGRPDDYEWEVAD